MINIALAPSLMPQALAGVTDPLLLEDRGIHRRFLHGQPGVDRLILRDLLARHFLPGHLLDDLHRHDLVFELAGARGGEGFLVRLHGVLILLLPRDLKFLGQVLRRAAHQLSADRIGEALPQAIGQLRVAQSSSPSAHP